MSTIVSDPRIDPRIKALMGMMPGGSQPDVGDREELLAEVNTPDALAIQAATTAMLDALDNEDVAPWTGLTVTTHEFVSAPDERTERAHVHQCARRVAEAGSRHLICTNEARLPGC